MIVNFVYNDKLSSIILPNKISGQFWFSDSRDCNVVRIEGVNNKWMIKTQSQYAVRVKNVVTGNNTDITSDEIVSKRLYQIKNLNSIKDRIYLFTEEYTEDRIEFYLFQIPESFSLTIGNGKVPKTITYDNEYVSVNHAIIQYSNGQWELQDDDSKNGTFVNGIRVNTETLKYGDMIFIMGMKIVVGKGCFSINNLDKKVKFCTNELSVFTVHEMIEIESDEIQDEEIYFDRSPRFKRDIEEVEMPIDSPPRENNQDKMPIILTVGSVMTILRYFSFCTAIPPTSIFHSIHGSNICDLRTHKQKRHFRMPGKQCFA